MNTFALIYILLDFICCSQSKIANQWPDDTHPLPTTPTNTRSFPAIMTPLQTWPTDPIPWPPTMSPYPTVAPHVITTGSSKKKSISKVVIITIAVLSAVFLAAIIFSIIMIIKKVRAGKLSQYKEMLNSLSVSDLAKTE